MVGGRLVQWLSRPAGCVRVFEVGPRDGLQNEPKSLAARTKAELIRRLANAGLRRIEAGSFVSPKWIPQVGGGRACHVQMADTADVFQHLGHVDAELSVLVPNERGLEAALSVVHPALKEVAVFTAASETFSRKNTHCTVDESLQRIAVVARLARARGLRVRGYVSTVVGCPYEGAVEPTKVLQVALELLRLGCYEVSLGDTVGVGTPGTLVVLPSCAGSVHALLALLGRSLDLAEVAVHFHDTYGQALANILVALQCGIRTVDAAVAGLGGCPYAPGAGGNVATEDVVYMLHGLGFETGVEMDRLVAAAAFVGKELGRESRSKAGAAWQLRTGVPSHSEPA